MDKSESKIQQEIYEFFHNKYCSLLCNPRSLIAHVPNEGQHRLCNIGVYPGFSDLFIIHNVEGSDYPQPIFIEVKTPTGKQSPAQIKFQKHAADCNTPYYIVRSLEEFKQLPFLK